MPTNSAYILSQKLKKERIDAIQRPETSETPRRDIPLVAPSANRSPQSANTPDAQRRAGNAVVPDANNPNANKLGDKVYKTENGKTIIMELQRVKDGKVDWVVVPAPAAK